LYYASGIAIPFFLTFFGRVSIYLFLTQVIVTKGTVLYQEAFPGTVLATCGTCGNPWSFEFCHLSAAEMKANDECRAKRFLVL
jgi:hypothetical protein